MKLTKETLKKIIKEELRSVLAEANFPPDPSDMNIPEEQIPKILRIISSGAQADYNQARMFIDALGGDLYWIDDYIEYENQKIFDGDDGTLRWLAQVKLELMIEKDCDSSYESCFVNVDDLDYLLGRGYGSAYEVLDKAENAGWFDSDGYDEDNMRVDLLKLFPGRFTPDELPIFDKSDDDYYSDQNIRALLRKGYVEDYDPYGTFTSIGQRIKKLLGF